GADDPSPARRHGAPPLRAADLPRAPAAALGGSRHARQAIEYGEERGRVGVALAVDHARRAGLGVAREEVARGAGVVEREARQGGDLRGGPARGGGPCTEIGGERPERVGVEADRHPARAVREGAAEGVRRRPADEEWRARGPRAEEERPPGRPRALPRGAAGGGGAGRGGGRAAPGGGGTPRP